MEKESTEMNELGQGESQGEPPSPSVSRQFEEMMREGLTAPNTQTPPNPDSGRRDVSVSIDGSFVWLPSRAGMGSGYMSRIERLKQMDLSPNYLVFHIYTPLGASSLAIFLGVVLIILSLVLFFVSSTVKLEVPYSELDAGPLTIKLTKDFKPPIYIYYKISDFYVTHKRVVYDSDPELVSTSSCKSFKTFAEILDLRCINGKNTLNGIDEWCQDYHNNAKFNQPAYPCGPLAATMMTDSFEICRTEIPRNSDGTYEGADFDSCLNIQIQDQMDLWRFSTFTMSKKKYADGFCWIDLTNPLYHTWLMHPFTNNFLKPYGVIRDEMPEGEYKIHLVTNLWPSVEWKAKKAIYLSCTSLVGTKSLLLEIVLLSISAVYILTGIVILVLHLTGFKINKSPWRGLDKVTVGIVTEKEGLIRRSSTSEAEVSSVHIPPGPGKCLCPLH